MVYRSDCQYLPYSIHFCEFTPIFFSREKGQNTKILKVWYENGRRWLLGMQSINTERASLTDSLHFHSQPSVFFVCTWRWKQGKGQQAENPASTSAADPPAPRGLKYMLTCCCLVLYDNPASLPLKELEWASGGLRHFSVSSSNVPPCKKQTRITVMLSQPRPPIWQSGARQRVRSSSQTYQNKWQKLSYCKGLK